MTCRWVSSVSLLNELLDKRCQAKRTVGVQNGTAVFPTATLCNLLEMGPLCGIAVVCPYKAKFDKGAKRRVRCLSPVNSARAARCNVLMDISLSFELLSFLEVEYPST